MRGGAVADEGEGGDAAAVLAVGVFGLTQNLGVVHGLLVDAVGGGVGEGAADGVFDVDIVDERHENLVTNLQQRRSGVGGLVDGDEFLADAVVETNDEGAAIVVDSADHGAVGLAVGGAEIVITANQRTKALVRLDVSEVFGRGDGSGGDSAELHGHVVILRASKLNGLRLISLFASNNPLFHQLFHQLSNCGTVLETRSQGQSSCRVKGCWFGCFWPVDWEKEKISLE